MSYQIWNVLLWVFLALAIVLAVSAAVFFKVARVRQAHAALQGRGVEEEIQRLRSQRAGSWADNSARAEGRRNPGAKYSHAGNDVSSSEIAGIRSIATDPVSSSGAAEPDADGSASVPSPRSATSASDDEQATVLRTVKDSDADTGSAGGETAGNEESGGDEGETVLWRNLPHDADITDADEALTRLMGAGRRH